MAKQTTNNFVSNLGVEWAVLTASPLPVLLLYAEPGLPVPFYAKLAMIALSVAASIFFAYFILIKPKYAKSSGILSIVLIYAIAFPLVDSSPFYTLIANVLFIGLLFLIIDISPVRTQKVKDREKWQCYTRASWSAHTLTLILFIFVISDPDGAFHRRTLYLLMTSYAVTQLTFIYWAYCCRLTRNVIAGGFMLLAGLSAIFISMELTVYIMLMLNLSASVILFMDKSHSERMMYWWDVILLHPARMLFTTFFMLCLAGSILLQLPAATVNGYISFIDAVFTAVSAVCVTGLIVLDTPHDFTLFGQFIILILIQLGGLGIMTITTIAIQSLGKRLSLKHETVLTAMTETDHKSLINSLSVILKYTFALELVGASLLTLMFLINGDGFGEAMWRGVFTSISAFCNAGFALQTDSLMGYNSQPMVLNTVAMLIFLGGMAPAAALSIPYVVRGKSVPISYKLALSASVIMVVAGALMYLAFEWDVTLSGLSVFDKFWNALFQSVTLRTAGFNSVDIANATAPSLIIMHIFMFIGGSPGGTAGGIKTTTIAVLILTFWSNISNRKSVLYNSYKISEETIYKAVTIIIAGFIVWFAAVIMVEVTQQIPTRELMFEVTSAIGTVGLSIGATAQLDAIGKLVIVIAMFAGRIGPVTMFTFLSRSSTTGTEHIEKNITLT
jgi:trk system potassium uptake protein TrkH